MSEIIHADPSAKFQKFSRKMRADGKTYDIDFQPIAKKKQTSSGSGFGIRDSGFKV
jgi:hypothetical protein